MASTTLPEIGTWKNIHCNKRSIVYIKSIITRLDLVGHVQKWWRVCSFQKLWHIATDYLNLLTEREDT